MPLPEPTAPRTPLHHRTIEIRGWKRDDGLYDIEGHLLDRKAVDFKLASGVRTPGEPIHSLWLRITVDPERKPFQLDKCHALAADGPSVARYYPKWYRGIAPTEARGESDNP